MKPPPTITEGPGELAQKLVADMEAITLDRIGTLGLENAEHNKRFFHSGQSLAVLRGVPMGEGDSCVVIAAGPSVKRENLIQVLKDSNYSGTIVTTESALSLCLRNGIVPHLTVSLDPHATRIVRWFGDPKLNQQVLENDDYFRRQDMDAAFSNEIKLNNELLDLLNRHGKDIAIALSTSASEAVVSRVIEAKMPTYWWNPMYDDPDRPDSVTRALYRANRFPCVNAGGNVGTAAWMMAHSVLGKKHVATIGMDMSYYGDTPYFNTQYYHELVDLVGIDNLDSVFVKVRNPYVNRDFYTDPAYLWYRNCFLELVQDADCTTYNCSGAGILFGPSIEVLEFDRFLDAFSGK